MSKDDFWDRVASVNAGMLDAKDGARFVPMSHYADKDLNALWFITAKGTDAVDAAETGPTDCGYILSDSGKGLYAHITGSLTVSYDKAKLDELWNPIAATWFDEGKEDPDLRLLCFRIAKGEVWLAPASGVVFMFNIARAKLTGSDPDMGSHFTF